MTQRTEEHSTGSINTLEDAIVVIRTLVAENQELRAEIARLKKDSSTSSKPPSSDITKPEHERKQSGVRKQGGQVGHKGHTRQAFPAERIDRRVSLKQKQCDDCHKKLKPTGEIKLQQVAELVPNPVVVTEYMNHEMLCSCCGKKYYKELPDGVVEGLLLGVRLQTFIGYLKGHLGSSYSEIQELAADALGISLSRSHLCTTVMRLSSALKGPHEDIGQAIKQAPSVNIDETGWYDQGERLWTWLFCNSRFAFFSIEDTRSTEVLKKVLGETFSGAITSDFYSAYICYACPKQQFCLAHLIRELKFLLTLPCERTKRFGEVVLSCFKRLFKLWHNKTDLDALQKSAKRLRRRLFMYILSTKTPAGDATRIAKRLSKHWDSLFRFVDEPTLYEPTNNRAERILRFMVRIRRHTQGSRSKTGQRWAERIFSVLATCRLQGRSAWAFLLHCMQAQISGDSCPVLSIPLII